MNTPWGESQHTERLAVKEGLISVSTPGHGGVYVPPELIEEFTKALPGVNPFAGLPWLEEDQDASLIYAAWPWSSTDHECFIAWEQMQRRTDIDLDAYKDTDQGFWLHASAARHADHTANRWRVGSMGSTEKGWNVQITRGDVSEWAELWRYPTQAYYTDEELDAVRVHEGQDDPGFHRYKVLHPTEEASYTCNALSLYHAKAQAVARGQMFAGLSWTEVEGEYVGPPDYPNR